MELFPDYEEDDYEEDDTVDTEVYFYLWEDNLVIFNIFKILMRFLGEYYSLDTAIMLALIAERKLSLEQSLLDVSYIHSGYAEILNAKGTTNVGQSKESNPQV